MNVHTLAVEALLCLGLIMVLLSCAGALLMPGAMRRLHYIGPLTMVAPVCIALAIAITKTTYNGAGYKAAFIALVLAVFGPVLSHETARMVHARKER